MNCGTRDKPQLQSYPDKNSAFPEGSVSRMTGICTPAKSQKHSEFRQCSRPFRSDTTNGLMNMERLENIGPAPDSGPMRHIRIKDPQRRLYYGSSARKSHGFKQKTKTKYVKAEAYHRFFSKNAQKTRRFSQRHRLFHESVTISRCLIVTTIPATLDATIDAPTIEGETLVAVIIDATTPAALTIPSKSNRGYPSNNLGTGKLSGLLIRSRQFPVKASSLPVHGQWPEHLSLPVTM